jgi:hypothetical protein
VKGPSELDYAVTVNGVMVPENRVGAIAIQKSRRIAAVEYIGIQLAPGKNEIGVTGRDPFGNIRGEGHISLFSPGEPKRIILTSDSTELPADGESKAKIAIKLVDADGLLVATRLVITIDAGRNRIEAAGQDLVDIDLETPGIQIAVTG